MTTSDPLASEHQGQALLNARYGTDASAWPAPPGGSLNPVLEALLSHRSVRAFDDRPLAEGTLEWLVAAAQSAPSSSNLQTWSVVAVRDPQRKARIAELVGHQAHVRQAPLLLVWLADLSRLRHIAQAAGQAVEGLDYLDTWLMAVIDAALAAQNAVTAAESAGLGTVYIGAIRNRPEEIAAELGLPAGTFAVFGLCVGHPDAQRPTHIKPRLPLSAVLSHEQFQPVDVPGDVAGYDRAMAAFYESQGLPVARWTDHSLARLRGPADLKGRDRLREALAAQGFVLR
jgi:nitroreductase